jgi:hypothetical protein
MLDSAYRNAFLDEFDPVEAEDLALYEGAFASFVSPVPCAAVTVSIAGLSWRQRFNLRWSMDDRVFRGTPRRISVASKERDEHSLSLPLQELLVQTTNEDLLLMNVVEANTGRSLVAAHAGWAEHVMLLRVPGTRQRRMVAAADGAVHVYDEKGQLASRRCERDDLSRSADALLAGGDLLLWRLRPVGLWLLSTGKPVPGGEWIEKGEEESKWVFLHADCDAGVGVFTVSARS